MKNNRIVYLIDLIGSHAGMDYYDSSFCGELNASSIETHILSNFSEDDNRPFLHLMYGKNKVYSLFLMMYNYWKLFFFCIFHRRSSFVYMSFGEVTDFLFFTLSILSKNFYVDIHELYAARYSDNEKVKSIFNFIYRNFVKKVILHSNKTADLLDSIGYTNLRLFVPHFKYSINKNYEAKNIGNDVAEQFNTTGVKFLFFGNLRIIKGIDVLLDYFTKKTKFNGVELVIAGKNVENIDLDNLRIRYGIIDRHINDDEMRYLFKNTDYVLLPYRDSSQSGILEMAFTFRKPMLLSNIPYFNMIYTKFPSFGEMIDIEHFDRLLDKIIDGEIQHDYYLDSDCNKFLMRDEISDFIKSFKKNMN